MLDALDVKLSGGCKYICFNDQKWKFYRSKGWKCKFVISIQIVSVSKNEVEIIF